MTADWWTTFVILAVLAFPAALPAAELPSQKTKPRPAEALKHCDVAGSPGVLAANGLCVKVSGYVSGQFIAGRLK